MLFFTSQPPWPSFKCPSINFSNNKPPILQSSCASLPSHEGLVEALGGNSSYFTSHSGSKWLKPAENLWFHNFFQQIKKIYTISVCVCFKFKIVQTFCILWFLTWFLAGFCHFGQGVSWDLAKNKFMEKKLILC